jgi:hypothetical protein
MMPRSSSLAARRAPAGTVTGRIWPAALAVWVLASGLTWLRLPAAARDTFWAEDGHQFVADWLHDGGPATLIQGYGGYIHLLPRGITWLVVEFVPISAWASVTTAAACVVTGGVAALVFVFSRDVVAAWAARVGLALIVVLTPLAGMEILGNVANVHWYLLYLTPWLLLATPRSRVGSVLMVLLALAVTLTEPQAILFVPLALWRFLKVPAVRPVVYGYAVGLAAQVLSTLLAGRSRTGGLPPPLSVAEGYWANAALSVFTGNGQWTGWLIFHVGWWVTLVAVLVFTLFGLYAFVFGRPIVRLTVLSLVLGSLVIWCSSYIFNNDANLYYSHFEPERFLDLTLTRYGAVPAMMLASMVPLAVGVLLERRPALMPVAVALVIGLTVVMSLNFVQRDNHRSGVPWRLAVDAARAQCLTADPTTDVHTQPDNWVVPVPCARLAGE